jgi:hypothetical protein
MLLKSCLFGHILECWGVVRVVPLMIDKIEINLDFHIFERKNVRVANRLVNN